jgi:hypothetical protein
MRVQIRLFLDWTGLGLLAAAGLALSWGLLGGCAATPVRLECADQRMRLNSGDVSEDQRRFGQELLEDCEKRLDSAQSKDSTLIENLNQRMTPGDSL